MKSKIRHYLQQIKNGRLQQMLYQLKWIYKYSQKHVFAIIIYTLIGLSGTVVSLFSSLVSKDLVDIVTGHNTGELFTTFCWLIGTQLGSNFMSQLSCYVSTKVSMKVDNSIKADIFDQIMISDWESLSQYHSGDILTRWSSDVTCVSIGILNLAPNLIIYLFRFISALIMVVHYDASFAIFALISVPFSFFTSRNSMKRMKKSSMNSLSINARMSSFNQEAFSNIQTVKAFDLVGLYSKRLRNLQKEFTDVRMKYQKISSINTIILSIVAMIVTYSTYGWGVYKVWNGAITYGTMTMFISLSSTLSGTVSSLIGLVPSSISLTNSARRLMDIAGLPKEDYSQKDKVLDFYQKHRDKGIGLCIRDLQYAYATGTEVFEHAFIDAHPHEIVAFVGPSGEGKTTMLRYLLSIIRAQKGNGYICVGDATPENSDMCMPLTASVRQLFAYVPQGNTMFYGTIADNMRNVKEDATDEEIINALKVACAWDFVEKLPNGINSEIRENGGGFSEGQAQRLSIARAVLRQSPILLLDEATSALDIMTERKVLQNIMQDKYPRTSIVTTHRPSVLKMCNRVYSIREKQCVVLSHEEIEDMLRGF
ncbi:MAG TPA: ABC transporter ATP-binding protein [Lachnospiraceae bacterium]|nr:ABC transporter ATP-binding protein [Lachnospiraceae bacterium]